MRMVIILKMMTMMVITKTTTTMVNDGLKRKTTDFERKTLNLEGRKEENDSSRRQRSK